MKSHLATTNDNWEFFVNSGYPVEILLDALCSYPFNISIDNPFVKYFKGVVDKKYSWMHIKIKEERSLKSFLILNNISESTRNEIYMELKQLIDLMRTWNISKLDRVIELIHGGENYITFLNAHINNKNEVTWDLNYWGRDCPQNRSQLTLEEVVSFLIN